MRLRRIARVAELLQTANGRDRLRRAWLWKEAQHYAEAITVRDRHGNRVVVSLADPWIGRSLLLDATHDPDNVDNLVRALAERHIVPDRIIDIGANIGSSTLELLAIYPNATAISIEPYPANYLLLSQNVIINGLEERVRTVDVAVGDHHGTARLTVSSSNPGDNRVDSSLPAPTIEVPMRRLDELAQVDDAVTLLWVDVQGYEGHVFRGCGDLLGAPALVEFWPFRLKEVGGYSWFQAAVSSYRTVLEVRGTMHPVADLDELGASLGDWYTDLLLLP